MSIWNYADLLPTIEPRHRITLGEGGTPLVRSRSIGPSWGMDHLYFKLESGNPTGSYKDRFAAAAISFQRAECRTLCLGTSSGNTGAAVAAYCAAARIPCFLAIVDTAPEGKLKQMMAYGAHLFRVKDFGTNPEITSTVMNGLFELADSLQGKVEISAFCFSPLGMAGVQTISYELADQLPDGVDHVFSPSGGGGLTLGVARGFLHLAQQNSWPTVPVHCVQPEGNNTIAGPLRAGKSQGAPCTSSTSISGLQVGSILDGNDTLAACRKLGGTGHLVSDPATYAMQKRLAREEGLFSEPAGAVALSAIPDALEAGIIRRDQKVVCLVTGTGFKDERALTEMLTDRSCPRLDGWDAFSQAVREKYASTD